MTSTDATVAADPADPAHGAPEAARIHAQDDGWSTVWEVKTAGMMTTAEMEDIFTSKIAQLSKESTVLVDAEVLTEGSTTYAVLGALPNVVGYRIRIKREHA